VHGRSRSWTTVGIRLIVVDPETINIWHLNRIRSVVKYSQKWKRSCVFFIRLLPKVTVDPCEDSICLQQFFLLHSAQRLQISFDDLDRVFFNTYYRFGESFCVQGFRS
jgi:hypothetical protein